MLAPFEQYPPTRIGRAPGRALFEAVFVGAPTPAVADLVCYPGVHTWENESKFWVRFGLNVEEQLFGRRIHVAVPVDEARAAFLGQAPWDLRPVQVEAARFLTGSAGALLNLPVGSGKTRVLAAAARLVTDKPVLIITTQQLAPSWMRELIRVGELDNEHDPRWARLQGLPLIQQAVDPDALAKRGLHPKARWIFCHPEILGAWDFALRGRCDVCIVDEGHLFRNQHTKRGQAVRVATQPCHYVWFASATPRWKKPGEIWGLLDILLPTSFGSENLFRTRYLGAERHPRGYGYINGDLTNQEELASRLKPVLFARTREECGIIRSAVRPASMAPGTKWLPPCRWDLLEVPASKKLLEESEAVLGADPKTILEMLLSGRSLGKNTLRFLNAMKKRASAEKIPTTVDYASSLIEQDESVLIFTAFIETAEKISRAITTHTGMASCVMHGEVSPVEREQAFSAFTTFDAKALVATYDVLSMGVDGLQNAARCQIQHDLTWVPAIHMQAGGRLDRPGQLRDTRISLVYAAGTLDEFLARALSNRVDALEGSGENMMDYGVFTSLTVESDVDRWFRNK